MMTVRMQRKLIEDTRLINLDPKINPFELAGEIGRYQLAINLLLNSPRENQPLDLEGRIRLDVIDYKDANPIIPGLVAQMYRLEQMFPPEIAFLGGLIDNGTSELIGDLEGETSFANIAYITFPHTKINNEIMRAVLGEVPENLSFVIGYAQGSLECNQRMNMLGFSSYICSVITDHNFRLINGIGSRMVSPILERIDKLGKSYLTTWVDTGSERDKVNLSHYPGVGFWYNQHYDPLTIEESEGIIDGVRTKHEESGIFGRSYRLREITVEETNRKLYGNNFKRRLGPRGTNAYDFIELRKKPFVVMPEHYETGWTGIIMTRDPEIVRDRMDNPKKYGIHRTHYREQINTWGT